MARKISAVSSSFLKLFDFCVFLVEFDFEQFELLGPLLQILLQLLYLLFHSAKVLLAFLVELLIGKLQSLLRMCEPSKEKSKDRIREESLLRLLAILIHRVSHQREVYRVVRDKIVVFVVSMRVHYHSEEGNELLLVGRWELN